MRRELKRLGGREMLVVGAPANSPNNSPSDPPSDPPSDAPSDAPPRSKPRAVGLPSALQVFLLTTAGENTLAAIHHALASERPSRALLFVESGKSVDAELRLLREAGLREAIHVKEVVLAAAGVRVTGAKGKAKAKVKASAANDADGGRVWDGEVLVASPGSARGLDISGVDLVIILGAPRTPDDLLHLAGRTARQAHTRARSLEIEIPPPLQYSPPCCRRAGAAR